MTTDAQKLQVATDALKQIAREPGCGCSHPCWCNGEEWERINTEGLRGIADTALAILAAPSTEQPAATADGFPDLKYMRSLAKSLRSEDAMAQSNYWALGHDAADYIEKCAAHIAATERAATQPAGDAVFSAINSVRPTSRLLDHDEKLITHTCNQIAEKVRAVFVPLVSEAATSGSAEPAAAASVDGELLALLDGYARDASRGYQHYYERVIAWGAQQREAGRAEGYVDGKGLAHEIVQAIDKPINARAVAAEKERDELRVKLARPVDLSGLSRYANDIDASFDEAVFVLFADVQALLAPK